MPRQLIGLRRRTLRVAHAPMHEETTESVLILSLNEEHHPMGRVADERQLSDAAQSWLAQPVAPASGQKCQLCGQQPEAPGVSPLELLGLWLGLRMPSPTFTACPEWSHFGVIPPLLVAWVEYACDRVTECVLGSEAPIIPVSAFGRNGTKHLGSVSGDVR